MVENISSNSLRPVFHRVSMFNLLRNFGAVHRPRSLPTPATADHQDAATDNHRKSACKRFCSLRKADELHTDPPTCLGCSFAFRKRQRLTRPGASANFLPRGVSPIPGRLL